MQRKLLRCKGLFILIVMLWEPIVIGCESSRCDGRVIDSWFEPCSLWLLLIATSVYGSATLKRRECWHGEKWRCRSLCTPCRVYVKYLYLFVQCVLWPKKYIGHVVLVFYGERLSSVASELTNVLVHERKNEAHSPMSESAQWPLNLWGTSWSRIMWSPAFWNGFKGKFGHWKKGAF